MIRSNVGPHDNGAHVPLVIAIAVLALALYAVHFPGQASYDTLAQAFDGATHVYTSNQPPAMSRLMFLLTLPGVLALQVTLFALAVWRLLALTGGAVFTRYLLLVVLFLFPVLLIYAGIVWKDVLFAHGAVLAVLLLPRPQAVHRWQPLVASAAILAVAVAVRQQGAIVAIGTLAYLLLGGGLSSLRHARTWQATAVWLVIFLSCTGGIRHAVQTGSDISQSGSFAGPLRQLAMFDLGGVLNTVPQLDFPAIAAGAMLVPEEHRPTRERVIEQLQRYSPQRQDFMAEADDGNNLWIPPGAWFSDWAAIILQHPAAYLVHRLDFMAWLLGCHEPLKCLPFYLGIQSEPQEMAATLGVPTGVSVRAKLLENLGEATLFLFRPWIYLCLSIGTLGVLLWRNPQRLSIVSHGPMITLQLCGLLYAASYLFIGIACDFRYTYFCTITGLFGAAYVIGVLREGHRP